MLSAEPSIHFRVRDRALKEDVFALRIAANRKTNCIISAT